MAFISPVWEWLVKRLKVIENEYLKCKTGERCNNQIILALFLFLGSWQMTKAVARNASIVQIVY